MPNRRMVWSAAVAGLIAAWAWAALRICPSCGHEVAEDAERCGHCSAVLPPVPRAMGPVPAAPAETAPAPAATGAVPDSVTAEQVAVANRMFEKGIWWMAVLCGRNAAAMLALKGPEAATTRVAVAGRVREARKRLTSAEQPCPVCKGTGARQMKALTLKGDIIEQTVVGGKCPFCHGTGRVPARAPDEQLAVEEAQALQAYAAEQQQRGLEETRGIWLPPGVWEGLTPRQQSAARKAFGAPCDRCRGFGTQSCPKCNGAGVLPCPNANCASGIEICPDCNGKGRSSGSRGATRIQTRCETCNSTGKRTCSECGGRGYLRCADCQGNGEQVCAACRGTGEGHVCTKCQGDGILVCTRCGGSGQQKGAPCPACRGAGATLCKSCNGAGRVSRR